MNILRVFPRRTKATPTDALAFVGEPPLPPFLPEAEEVHVSVTFTWDVEEGYRLQQAWEQCYPGRVRIGGPAFGDRGGDFVPGMYLREGYTITSRGCPNRCSYCLVPGREGEVRELYPISGGHIVQDNNLLACSELHWWRVLAMLAGQQKAARFTGGFEAERFTYERAFELYSNVRVDKIWLAYDSASRWDAVREAIRTGVYWFGNGRDAVARKVRCYVLAGHWDDTPERAVARCEQVLNAGALPFLMLWQPADRLIRYSADWRAVQRKYTRPAAMLTGRRELEAIG